MEVFFTICSNNYLAYAKVLGQSLKKHNPGAVFFIFLCDERHKSIDYASLADEVVLLSDVEPRIGELAARYNIVELNTSLKPRVFEYLFTDRKVEKAVFLDPDIKVYASLSELFSYLNSATTLLVPHIYTPIPFDRKTPAENTFLNFGLYNLGFIGLRRNDHTSRFLQWWMEHTYRQGFIDVYKGIFVDQLPVNLAPIFFNGVEVLTDRGLNMAPWNLHERRLNRKDGQWLVNDADTLKFYHFSSFNADLVELPVQHYNRFRLADRPDLRPIYEEYRHDLLAAGHPQYKPMVSAYSAPHEKRNASTLSRLKSLFSFRNRS